MKTCDCLTYVRLNLEVLARNRGIMLLTALLALVLTAVFSMGDVNRIIISAMMPLLPGLAMTNAIRDAMRGDLVSGVARAGEALIRAIVLAAGAGLSISAWMLIGGGA